ncbi:MAG: hypothetical protein ACKVT0_01510 [Planctomycetaceae bacterium]
MAGKRVRCKACQEVFEVPLLSASESQEEIYDAEVEGDNDPDLVDIDDYVVDDQKPCPACGEMIRKTATKCRFCGEIFDPILKKQAKKRQRSSGNADADEDLSTGDYIVAILCSGIGCIAGIVWMIQGKPKGSKMFFISFGMQIFWGVIQAVVQQIGKNN